MKLTYRPRSTAELLTIRSCAFLLIEQALPHALTPCPAPTSPVDIATLHDRSPVRHNRPSQRRSSMISVRVRVTVHAHLTGASHRGGQGGGAQRGEGGREEKVAGGSPPRGSPNLLVDSGNCAARGRKRISGPRQGTWSVRT